MMPDAEPFRVGLGGMGGGQPPMTGVTGGSPPGEALPERRS